ncbi:MAG: superoxide dismutase [Mn], partial [Verrucomicrobiaceae bacterium]
MKRRHLLSAGGAAIVGSVFNTGNAVAVEGVLGLELPKLPYAPAALEPHIDVLTMTIHHDKHHQAYITKLGDALKAANINSTDTLELVKGVRGLPEGAQTAIRNNAG